MNRIARDERNVLELRIPDQEEGVCVLALDGRLNHETTIGLREKIMAIYRESPADTLALDFAGLLMVDSQGLGMLLHLYRDIPEKRRNLVIRNPNESVRKVLTLTRIDALMKIEG